MSRRREKPYEMKFILLSDRVERWLLRSIAVLFIVMLIGQMLLRVPLMRQVLSPVDRMEGEVFVLPGMESANSGS